jgi:hypothetical protein
VVRFLVIAFRVLLVLLVLRLIFRAVAALRRPAPPGEPRPSGELVRDRVCNTFVPRERAIRARVGGREEHFCSPGCRDRALAAHARAS